MIYFIQNTETKAIKIGYTHKDPHLRLRALQTGSSAPLLLILTIEGTLDDEKDIHSHLSDSRATGEWFKPTMPVAMLMYYYLKDTFPFNSINKAKTVAVMNEALGIRPVNDFEAEIQEQEKVVRQVRARELEIKRQNHNQYCLEQGIDVDSKFSELIRRLFLIKDAIFDPDSLDNKIFIDALKGLL